MTLAARQSCHVIHVVKTGDYEEICPTEMSLNIVDFQLAIKYPDAG